MKRLMYSLLAAACLLVGCKEQVDTSDRYVFSEYTCASYLEKFDYYSEYVNLLKIVPISRLSETTVYQILTARGNYTIFAPTNEAIQAYLQKLTDEGFIPSPSWDAFTNEEKLDSIRKVIVLNSIIDGGNEFSQRIPTTSIDAKGEDKTTIGLPNMKEKRLSCTEVKGSLLINGCAIDKNNRDIEVTNGYIHQVHGVIAPEEKPAIEYFREIVERGMAGTDGSTKADESGANSIVLFSKAVLACMPADTLSAIRDEVYEKLRLTGVVKVFENYMQNGMPSDMTGNNESDAIPPEHRNYGFTFFAEKDDYWITQGIKPMDDDALEQLQRWISKHSKFANHTTYVENNDYKSPKNLLNQWLTYHILPMKLLPDQLVYHCNEMGYGYTPSNSRYFTLPVMEWYPCYGPDRRLIKLYESDKSDGIYLNRFAPRNRGRYEDGKEAPGCPPELAGVKILTKDPLADIDNLVNACVYPIDKPLAYDETTRMRLGKERIRFDGMALFPEAATNYIRRARGKEDKYNHVFIPANAVYQYFDNMSIMSEDTKFMYFNGYGYQWPLFCQDEMKAVGHYDIMFTMPPVPVTDTYEVRYKILATGARGVVQVYFGSDPDNLPVAGIPIDLRKDITYYIDDGASWEDNGDEDHDSELDHSLRNHMIMKSGRHETAGNATTRETSNNIRYIVARQTLYPGQTYYLRFKSVLDSDQTEFHLDYFELCPKSVYDNPEDPEDIW